MGVLMVDRITEIREVAHLIEADWMNARSMSVCKKAAEELRAYAGLLDSDALIIQRDNMVSVLIAHQRMDNSGCLCGWHELGHSWAAHVADAALASSQGVEP